MTYYVAIGIKGETIIATSAAARDEQLKLEGCDMTADGFRGLMTDRQTDR